MLFLWYTGDVWAKSLYLAKVPLSFSLAYRTAVLNGSEMAPEKFLAPVAWFDNHCERSDLGTFPASSQLSRFEQQRIRSPRAQRKSLEKRYEGP